MAVSKVPKRRSVAIGVAMRASEFDEYAPEAQKVIDTVKWWDS